MSISDQIWTSPNRRAPPTMPSTTKPTAPAGHPRLAELMVQHPMMGIYRRFGYLNTQNLLYMQAELVGLEKQLKELQRQDEYGGFEHTENRAHDWNELSKAICTDTATAESQGSEKKALLQGPSCCGHRKCEEWCCGEMNPHEHCRQWDLAIKIREKLQRYNDTLIQQMALASARSPDSYDLELIGRFLNSESFGMKDALLGDDRLLWVSEVGDANDMISLSSLPKRDLFTELMFKKLAKSMADPGSWWNKFFKIRTVAHKTLLRWATAATSAVIATVPIVSILALYFTSGNNGRLILLAVFNFLAAFVLYTLTDAQPVQVFGMSAAYNAVNIVFIGSNATATT